MRLSAQGASDAVVYVTLTVAARMMAYTVVRCPGCSLKLVDVPGRVLIEARTIESRNHACGRGFIVACKRCRDLCEVVEHGALEAAS